MDLHQWADLRGLVQVDLMLLVALPLICGLGLYLLTRRGRRSPVSRTSMRAAVCALAFFAPYGLAISNSSSGGSVTLLPHPHGGEPVTRDDLGLASWSDANLRPDQGLVALTCLPFRNGPGGRERFLHPIGAAQALLLYSKNYNFCFCQQDPWLSNSFTDYKNHVQFTLQRDWCLRHNIRYFCIPASLRFNPGLRTAIEQHQLRAIRSTGSAALYELTASD